MNILALDLGTKTGYAYNVGDSFHSGTQAFSVPAEVTVWGKNRMNRRRDPRIPRLHEFLEQLMIVQPDLVIFEDVQFQTYTLQCQLWSSFRAAVWLSFSRTTTQPIFECVDASTLKKFATGHGGATKGMMLSALTRKFPGFVPKKSCDDNEVDAIWLWLWAKQNLTPRQ